MRDYIFYNPLSNNKRGIKGLENLRKILDSEDIVTINVLDHDSIYEKLNIINPDDRVIIAGGDGTLNNFVNSYDISCMNLYYYPCGSGNDFARDLNVKDNLIPVSSFMKNLPVCTVNNVTRRFFNGVGFGIDGYCCIEGDKIRKKSDKKVNYALLALKGVIGGYKPVNATIEVDGVKKEYRKVWLCASMKGRFYGGGFMMSPNQDRSSEDEKISLVVAHNASKFKILFAFLFVFSGKHTMLKKNVEIFTGNNIKVEFDRPTDLQIDGEGFENILTYKAEVEKINKNKEVLNGI